ncbi:MAG: CotH kinase family protein [Prevotella sp.]|nr:CotH kinase family protein [Prevotella sp.]
MKKLIFCMTILAFISTVSIAQHVMSTKKVRTITSSKIDPTKNPTGFPKTPILPPSIFLDGIKRDLSHISYISIPEPRCAYVNLKGTTRLPECKGDTLHCWMEVDDGDGNYFCKRVVLDAQGDVSLMFPKKGMKVEFYDDEWVGNDKPTIAIGNWVSQDGFHLKAYYNDYFRGVGAVGYKLYELMVSDVGYPWARSGGLAAGEPLAMCHPDGFPCIVYLNGEFYGIYSWQLKKSHENMAQSKNNPKHIHLDGNLSEGTFWNGDIDWSAFEVRNPKKMSDETRECIVSLSRVCRELQQMSVREQNVEKLRAEFARRFDVQSLLDYVCLNYLIANYDGFAKNWQWFTYDGVKWFVAPYDLDYTFGNNVGAETISPPERTGVDRYWALYENGPMYWLSVYFKDEIRARYCQLRKHDRIGSTTVKALVHDWCDRIGKENYAEEWKRWADSKCINEPQYASCWKPVEKWRHYHKLKEWHSSTEYKKGDVCRLAMGEWEATADNQGVRPFVSLSYVDSMERLDEWIDKRFDLFDSYFSYLDDVGFGNFSSSASLKDNWSNAQESIYNLHGHRLSTLSPGVNIVVRKGEKGRKVAFSRK